MSTIIDRYKYHLFERAYYKALLKDDSLYDSYGKFRYHTKNYHVAASLMEYALTIPCCSTLSVHHSPGIYFTVELDFYNDTF